MIRVAKTVAGYQITVDVDDPIKPSLTLSRDEAWELLDVLRTKLAEEHHKRFKATCPKCRTTYYAQVALDEHNCPGGSTELHSPAPKGGNAP